MAQVDIGKCVSTSIDSFKRNPMEHIVATLIVGVVGGVSSGILTGPMMVGYMKMMKNSESTGKVEIGDVFKGFDDFVPAFLAVFVSSLLLAVGFCLCVIPGLLIMALPGTAAYLVAEGEKDGMKALSRAFDLIKANLLPSCLCMLVLGFIASLGMIACFVGILITLPIAYIGSYHLAKQMVEVTPPMINNA